MPSCARNRAVAGRRRARVGDRATVIGAFAARFLACPSSAGSGGGRPRQKADTRAAARRGTAGPLVHDGAVTADFAAIARSVAYPCVLKPLGLAAAAV